MTSDLPRSPPHDVSQLLNAWRQKTPDELAASLVEQPTRFSRSRLWELQGAFFQKQGVEAWRQEVVPHYVTSNPFVARCFARQVIGVFRDLLAGGLDASQPVYLVELGAGCGRFAYHFLTNFLQLHADSALAKIRFCYVITDHAAKTLEFLQQHEQFVPWVEAGQLDFARFDAGSTTSLQLNQSGQTLGSGSIANPMIVIANYVFDSLPQDVFHIENGELSECLIGLSQDGFEREIDSEDGEVELDSINPFHQYCQLSDAAAWSPLVRDILHTYQQELFQSHVLIPVGALACLDHLTTLADNGLVVISADMGYVRLDELERQPAPTWNTHGSISLTVNYDALARYVRGLGGRAYLTPPATHLAVGTFLLGLEGEFPETQLAFREAMVEPGPDAFFILKKQLERICHDLAFQEILAYLRLSHWDGKILLACYHRLQELIAEGLDPSEEENLSEAADRIWDQYFALADSFDLPFHLGTLLHQINYQEHALIYYGHSLRIWGEQTSTLHQFGLCHYGLRQFDAAQDYWERVLAIDPGFESAREMLQRLHAAKRRDSALFAGNSPKDSHH